MREILRYMGQIIFMGLFLQAFVSYGALGDSDAEERQAKETIREFVQTWDAPKNTESIFRQAQLLGWRWPKEKEVPTDHLAKFLHYGYYEDGGFAGHLMAFGLRELITERSNDELFQQKAVKVAVALSIITSAGAGFENGGIQVLNTLLNSKFSSVRLEVARSLQLWSPTRGGTHASIEDGYERLYVEKYFSESDEWVREELRKLVKMYDPKALVLGPKGFRRTLKGICNFLFRG